MAEPEPELRPPGAKSSVLTCPLCLEGGGRGVFWLLMTSLGGERLPWASLASIAGGGGKDSLSPTSLSSLPQTTGNVQRNMPGTGVVNHSTGGQSTVVFSEPFVVLCQRYIIAICNCKDIFQVDKTRTKQQVGIWLNRVDIFLYYYQYDM